MHYNVNTDCFLLHLIALLLDLIACCIKCGYCSKCLFCRRYPEWNSALKRPSLESLYAWNPKMFDHWYRSRLWQSNLKHILFFSVMWRYIIGLILALCPTNEGRCYKVTPSLIGCAQSLNQPCISWIYSHIPCNRNIKEKTSWILPGTAQSHTCHFRPFCSGCVWSFCYNLHIIECYINTFSCRRMKV